MYPAFLCSRASACAGWACLPDPRGGTPGRNLPGDALTLLARCVLNPYQAPRVELVWMSPQEQLQARLELSALRWALLAVLAGTVQVAASSRPGLLFLVVHGAAAALCLATGAWLAARRARRWLGATWPRWATEVLRFAAAGVALGLLGIVGAASLLGWLGHPEPFGPLSRLDTAALGVLAGSSGALALAGSGAWALAWRWRLGRAD